MAQAAKKKKTKSKSTQKTTTKALSKSAQGKKAQAKSSRKAAPAVSMEGKSAPKFSGEMTGGQKLSNSDLRGVWTVLYFYPKDNTSGCTLEGQNFRDQYKKFQQLGVQIVGVSPDSLKSHERFKEAQNFPFELLSDEDKSMAEAFKVWKEKSMYGRKYFGIERSTFLISPEGKIHKEWRKVKVPGHVDEVLAEVKAAL